jgi:hypothetical protein
MVIGRLSEVRCVVPVYVTTSGPAFTVNGDGGVHCDA